MAQEIFRIYGNIEIRGVEEAERQVSEVGNTSDTTSGKMEGLNQTLDDLGGGFAGVAGIITAVLIAALKDGIEFVDEMDNALGNLKGDTNATDKEMQGFSDSLENLYRKGYGDSLQDISDAMSNVHRQTGAVNEELEKQVENTMVLSEKLGTDYGETIRTVDNLVKIFGLTHEDAFNLIAKGYQENLNVGGDLLDLFNEYSVKFEQLGMDQDDMFNIMLEGQEQGIFNYDLLLDGIKEYQIRVAELAQDTEDSKEIFKDLGLNVKDVNDAYQKGGEAAKDMSIKIWEALDSIKDPLEKNRIGTELFGTMWEDTGGKINDAALGIQKDMKDTKGSMDDLINTKTDSLSEEWKQFKRDFELTVLKPLGEDFKELGTVGLKALNKLLDAIKKDKEMTDALIETLSPKLTKAIGDVKTKTQDMAKDGTLQLGLLEDAIPSVISWFNKIKDAVSGVIGKISQIDFPSIPSGFPGFADGIKNLSSPTMAIVGERGRELVYLPQGASVYSNQETESILNNSSGFNEISTGQKSTSINIEKVIIDPSNIKDMTDFIDIISNFKNNMISYGGDI